MTAINTNTASMNAQYYLAKTNKEMESSMAKLSSGLKVNSAADDAAGLAIASRMTSQIKGLNMAIKNANDTVALAQTAEGAMEEVTNMLQRMRELAVQSANGTMNDTDRASLDAEVQALKTEIDRVASYTQFNSQTLLDGSFSKTFQIGDKSGQTVDLSIASLSTASLGMGSGTSGNSVVSARIALADVDAGDIEINGQALGAIDGTNHDMEDLLKNINDNVDNVTATGFNVIVAENVGNGITGGGGGDGAAAGQSAADGLEITVTELGAAAATVFQISASADMNELVANINKETGGVVRAELNDSGKLVLSNTTGASIMVEDDSSSAGSGFTATNVTYTGFIKLTSDDNNPIRVEAGNKGLAIASVGSATDLAVLGMRQQTQETTADGYTMKGNALTAGGVATAFGQGDLTINGVEIYDADITTTSFTGKLDAINSFSSQTGVTASASFSKAFGIDTANLGTGGKFELNGTDITLTDGTLANLVADINGVTAATGLKASLNGNNVTLEGENIQTVRISYETAAEVTNGMSSTVEAVGSAVTDDRDVTIAAGDVVEGRTFTLASTDATAGAFSVTHTVAAGESETDVAAALVAALRAHSTAGADMRDPAKDNVTNALGVITIAGFATNGHGTDASLALTISTVPAIFGAAATHYAGIKLDSVNNTPISIDLGQGTAASDHVQRHGFFEANVGAADFDVNDPTLGVSSGSSISGLSVASSAGANSALSTLDNAIDSVNALRSDLGALQNRLDHTVNNLSSVSNNTQAAKGRIMDTDFASETANLTKQQILSQAATSMLAQANQSKQGILALLQG